MCWRGSAATCHPQVEDSGTERDRTHVAGVMPGPVVSYVSSGSSLCPGVPAPPGSTQLWTVWVFPLLAIVLSDSYGFVISVSLSERGWASPPPRGLLTLPARCPCCRVGEGGPLGSPGVIGTLQGVACEGQEGSLGAVSGGVGR